MTGVSGSGKSTLINDILYNALAAKLHGARLRPADHKEILGLSEIDKVINIDQSPIGRTPRSNPATYTGVLILFVNCSARQMKQNCAVISQGASALMLKADAVKLAAAMV